MGDILTLKFQNHLRVSRIMVLKMSRYKSGPQLLQHKPSRVYVQ